MSKWTPFTLVASGAAECVKKVSKDTACKYYMQSGKTATEVAADGTVYFGIQMTAHIEPPREGDDSYLRKDQFI